jgi:predicted dehydrogenase
VIAIARRLVGPITAVSSLAATPVAERPLPTGVFGYGEHADAAAARRAVENDDVTLFLAAFEHGAIGSFEASRSAAGRAFDLSFTVTGTRGAIRFDQQHMVELQVRLRSDPEDQGGFRHIQLGPGHGDYGRLWPIAGLNIGVHDLKLFEAFDLASAIVAGTRTWPDFREGYEVEKVIDAVDQASRRRQWVDVA